MTRQRFVADIGRVSMSSTRSPTPAAFCSSCALSLLVRRIVVQVEDRVQHPLYRKTMVLSILSLTT